MRSSSLRVIAESPRAPVGASPHRSARRLAGVGLAAGLLVAGLLSLTLLSSSSHTPSPTHDARADAAARRFLKTYVGPDGRVVRRDQGNDTVSEGQSYALLLAQHLGDQKTFDRVWRWTAAHLRRPDGLLASHTDATHVIDPTPASDADVVTAWALVRARGAGAGAYHREGRRMAAAVLAHETSAVGGSPALAAGPWATGSPATLNPSYWAVPAFTDLARATGDRRWSALAGSSVDLARRLSANGSTVPPDWARVDGTNVAPTPSPNGNPSAVQYGLDAQRLVVWLAAGCDAASRRLAAGWWPALSAPDKSQALALGADGHVIAAGPSALALVASAAAADAAGRPGDRDRLLARAEATAAAQPTYYGSAWVALGRVLLAGNPASRCTGAGSGS